MCRFGTNPQEKNQYLVGDEDGSDTGFPAPDIEGVTSSPNLFQYPASGGAARRRLLLDGISSRGRQPQLEAP